jgi:hypothetical protein
VKPAAPPDQMPPPAAPPKTPLTAFMGEVAGQVAPEYQGLAELLVQFRERPQPSDITRALFRAKKLVAVLEEAQRQLIARGAVPPLH